MVLCNATDLVSSWYGYTCYITDRLWVESTSNQLNSNVIILMKFSLLAAPEVVSLTTTGAVSDETFIKMTILQLECGLPIYIIYGVYFVSSVQTMIYIIPICKWHLVYNMVPRLIMQQPDLTIIFPVAWLVVVPWGYWSQFYDGYNQSPGSLWFQFRPLTACESVDKSLVNTKCHSHLSEMNLSGNYQGWFWVVPSQWETSLQGLPSMCNIWLISTYFLLARHSNFAFFKWNRLWRLSEENSAKSTCPTGSFIYPSISGQWGMSSPCLLVGHWLSLRYYESVFQMS